jgi:hypothetical protein
MLPGGSPLSQVALTRVQPAGIVWLMAYVPACSAANAGHRTQAQLYSLGSHFGRYQFQRRDPPRRICSRRRPWR